MSRSLLTEPQLVESARALAVGLPPGAVILLEGDLGTGKTTFARALIGALGVAGAGTSPTYSLVHRHESPAGPVYHLDCYRLRSPEEAADLDWDGIAAEARALIVEWPERAGAWVPAPTHRLRFAHVSDPDVREVSAP